MSDESTALITERSELDQALDELAKSKLFAVRDLTTRMSIETVLIEDFEVVRPAFTSNGSLGNLDSGSGYTLIPLDADLAVALRNVRHALGGLESPSYTMHTFHARIDHILDMVRALFKTQEVVSITKLEELQWLVYPYSRKTAGGEFQRVEYSVLGDMREFVMDMAGASEIEATGLRGDE